MDSTQKPAGASISAAHQELTASLPWHDDRPGRAPRRRAHGVPHGPGRWGAGRGAQVRDAHDWAGYLTEAIVLFGGDRGVVFASHRWLTWGRERAISFFALQRDVYAYLHDQTLRMLNQGLNGPEVAETMVLPPALANAWHAHGYYGSVSHNVKAVYQRYTGWYDGNPAHLWPHPPLEAARRYVEFMGGADEVVEKARTSFAAGDLRWAAEVLTHVVFALPDHEPAEELLADTDEQLGFGAENGTWRCAYLSGAHELRPGAGGTPARAAPRRAQPAPTCWPSSPPSSSSTGSPPRVS
ncbi:alkyl sulfatase dimerization domain-containing protein [Kocuria oceani]|uniref:Alkyl sulfatase dimerization domain-containing protein n=1 Tax=Kocuria oceani TaxID=988827 RepID=A0ABV9TNK0_9MICC|nr:alkyl sulfatase dimerization domain-containing protein [Kocuria oceani]